MKKIVLCLIYCFGLLHLSAQDLHIYYDTQTESLKYESGGTEVLRPEVANGSNIFLHIQNYNNYLYEVEVEANETKIIIPPNTEASNPFAGLLPSNLPALNLLSTRGEKTPNPFDFVDKLVLNVDTYDAISLLGKTRGGSQTLQIFRQEYNHALTAIQLAETELMAAVTEINQELEAQQVHGIIAKEIEKLKYHPRLNPAQIKRMSGEYLRTVFNVDSIGEIDLSYVLERIDPEKVMQKQLGRFRQKEAAYQKEVGSLRGIATRLNTLNLTEIGAISLMQSIEGNYLRSQGIIKTAKEDTETVQQLINYAKKDQVQYLTDLRYEYEAIMANDFSHTYRTRAKEDAIIFNIKFKKRDTAGNQVVSTKTFAPIEIPVSGGFKVNASLGLSFGWFNEARQDYYERETKILADDKGVVVPMLTSLIHFYQQNTKKISVGGSVGVGFPMSDGSNISSLSFLAGPSLIIGKSSRVILSAGLMTGQVERLAQGYQIGDTFISEADNVPVKQKYELGYFFSFSYNLGKSN